MGGSGVVWGRVVSGVPQKKYNEAKNYLMHVCNLHGKGQIKAKRRRRLRRAPSLLDRPAPLASAPVAPRFK